MKIGLVIDTCAPFYTGGYETRAWEIARRLASRHEVTIWTSGDAPRVLDDVRFEPLRPRVETFSSQGFRSLGEASRFSAAVLKRALHPPARSARVDVVDCNATPFLHIWPAKVLARQNRAAFVLTAHEALASQIVPYMIRKYGRPLGGVVGRGGQLMYSTMHRLPQRIIAASEVAGEELRKEGLSGVSACPGGVDSVGVYKRAYQGRLVTVARLVSHKHVEAVIEGFAVARQRGWAQSLTVIGDGPEREALINLALSLRLDHSIRFLHNVPDEEKNRILAEESDVYVSGSYREGFSIATLEALAQGCVAIVSSRPESGVSNGCLEYIKNGETGMVSNGSAEGIADAVHTVGSNDAKYEAMSRAGISVAERYTWDRVADQVEQVYVEAIQSLR